MCLRVCTCAWTELAARVSGLEFSNGELRQQLEIEKLVQQQNRR
jgi:hypothetical protein